MASPVLALVSTPAAGTGPPMCLGDPGLSPALFLTPPGPGCLSPWGDLNRKGFRKSLGALSDFLKGGNWKGQKKRGMTSESCTEGLSLK